MTLGSLKPRNEDVQRDHAQIAHAHRDAGLDELAVAQRLELAAHEARHRRPGHDRNGQDDASDRRTQNRDDEDGEEEGRNGLEDLGQSHENFVDDAAVIAGGTAHQHADERREQCGDDPDDERRAGTVDDAGQLVATQHVSAEQILIRRRQERLPGQFERACLMHERSHDRNADDRDQDQQPGQRRTIPREAAAKRERVGSHHRSRIRGSSSE
jgi:hypothetical protein